MRLSLFLKRVIPLLLAGGLLSSCAPSEEPAPSEVKSEAPDIAGPYGGQCGSFGAAVLQSTMALTGMGAANFDLDSERARDFISERGYGSFEDWIADVQTVRGAFGAVDEGALTSEEAATIETINRQFSASNTMTLAFASGDSDWYETTYEALIKVGAACDGQW